MLCENEIEFRENWHRQTWTISITNNDQKLNQFREIKAHFVAFQISMNVLNGTCELRYVGSRSSKKNIIKFYPEQDP